MLKLAESSVLDRPKESTFPLVSIGVPVFNGAAELKATIEALAKQDYQNLEIVISDNCSTDGTDQIALRLQDEYPMVKYFRNAENIGSFSNFEKVFRLAKGKYFMWQGHHDLLSTGFVSKAVQIMEVQDSVVNCFPRWSIRYEDGTEVVFPSALFDTRGMSRIDRFLLIAWTSSHCSEFYGLIRTSAIRKILPFKRILCMDVIFICDLASVGAFAFVSDERYYMWLRPFDIGVSMKRHGFKFDQFSPIVQYLSLAFHLMAVALKRFPFSEFTLLIMPSLLFCIAYKYIWIGQLLSRAISKKDLQSSPAKTEERNAIK